MHKFILKRAGYRSQGAHLSFMLLTVFSLMGAVPSAWAHQIKLVANYQTIKATVSTQELTQVFVTGDRIYQVRGLDGAYDLEQDEEHGTIYLKPTLAFRDKPFSVFVTTEAGRTYSLVLTPKEVFAESIELVPTDAKRVEAVRWEVAGTYEETLIGLMTAMAKGTAPEGYAKAPALNSATTTSTAASAALTSKVWPSGLSFVPIETYRGAHLTGETWQVIHRGSRPVVLTAPLFATPKIRAIGTTVTVLSSGQSTLLYRVVSHD